MFAVTSVHPHSVNIDLCQSSGNVDPTFTGWELAAHLGSVVDLVNLVDTDNNTPTGGDPFEGTGDSHPLKSLDTFRYCYDKTAEIKRLRLKGLNRLRQ